MVRFMSPRDICERHLPNATAKIINNLSLSKDTFVTSCHVTSHDAFFVHFFVKKWNFCICINEYSINSRLYERPLMEYIYLPEKD